MIPIHSRELNLLILPAIENIDEVTAGITFPVKVTKGKYAELEFKFMHDRVELLHQGINIKEFSYVWISSYWKSRDSAYSVKLYLDHFKIPHTFVEQATSKITDQLVFALNKITTPDTYFVEKHDITKYLNELEAVCEYPIIIKDVRGSRGKYSALCANREELLKNMSELPTHRKYMFQKFIENEYDWGILIANGSVVAAAKRYHPSGEFRNNICKGGEEIFVPIADAPEIIKNIAMKANNSLNLTWSRADIIIEKHSNIPYLLEVNRTPGITSGTSEISGTQEFLESLYQAYIKI